ncbi:Gluconeogenesis factor [Caloramator mitchellensis]|uniref:Putative gluconeogenesis factor n=1 Tax=Caloramator mitchellensis TaxID=908809 RepID=A0A0R3JU63_CALMK|nr:gluconeogenesis factor YvcK family protein [Caloramator mitchellensis]KRQ87095.1 Gluconeogenesis factor [Caloramator mitchellensis]
MSLFDWIKPGLNLKRWIIMGTLGVLVFILGVSKLLFRGAIFDWYFLLYLYITIIGIMFIYISTKFIFKSIFALFMGAANNNGLNRHKIEELLYEQRLLIRGPRIVAIGGGTGLSTMLRGLKEYTSNITAIVTVADDGGGSGVLRESLGILPPGDIRNCLVALANTEPLMEELMQYRFKEGNLKGQSFGNLFIAAMSGISSNFEEAIKKMSDVLAVQGKVFPATLSNVTLCAKLEDGSIVRGESKIPEAALEKKTKIESIYLEPGDVKPLEEAIMAIESADCIIMGPGSLYTSVLPNLVIKEIAESVKNSKAIKVYVSNIMTQPGETDGYKLSNHLEAIEKHCGKGIINYVIANNGKIPEEYYEKYINDGQYIVETDLENIDDDIFVIQENFVDINKYGYLRHNTRKLANTIMRLVLKQVFPKNRRRILDYYYLSEKIKDKTEV